MPHNAMPHNAMPHNGLSTSSLAENEALLGALASSVLDEGVFLGPPPAGPGGPGWSALLEEAHASDLVQYIVSCALDPCEHVKIPDGRGLADVQRRFPSGFPGELGLCSKSYDAWAAHNGKPGEDPWTKKLPTPACLERVSACVLARVNAVQARVPISMRGDGTSLVPRVQVETQFRENHGTPIQSFKRCDRMCLWGDRVRRNCDWEPRHVGQCVRDRIPGTAGASPRRVRLEFRSSTPVRVRICKGIYGCDDTDPALGAGAATAPVFANGHLVEFPTHYGGQMIHQGVFTRNGDTIEFECPDNGPLAQSASGAKLRTGYYSVMLGTLDPRISLTAAANVSLVPSAEAAQQPFATHESYPAREDQVFTYREGGFYGTLFSKPGSAAPARCEGTPGDQYACASAIWNPASASFTARHCAGPLSPRGCFGNPPGWCDVPSDPRSCDAMPAAARPKVYDDCGGGRAWKHPYTTYLNHPCDLYATDDECADDLSDRKEPAVRPAPRRRKLRTP